MTANTKQCAACLEFKAFAAFSVCRAHTDHLQNVCKACNALRYKLNPKVARLAENGEDLPAARTNERRAFKAAIRAWLSPIYRGGHR